MSEPLCIRCLVEDCENFSLELLVWINSSDERLVDFDPLTTWRGVVDRLAAASPMVLPHQCGKSDVPKLAN